MNTEINDKIDEYINTIFPNPKTDIEKLDKDMLKTMFERIALMGCMKALEELQNQKEINNK